MGLNDYSKTIKEIEHLAQQQQYKQAVRLLSFTLQHALTRLYDHIKRNASADDLKRLLAAEESISNGKEPFGQFSLDQIISFFNRIEIPGLAEPLTDRPLMVSQHLPLKRFRDFINLYARSNLVPDKEELPGLIESLKKFVSETGLATRRIDSGADAAIQGESASVDIPSLICPSCGESVEKGWSICPCCETSLIRQLICPECKKTVKEHWKRCPVCLTRLVCQSCGQRLVQTGKNCPGCGAQLTDSPAVASQLIEPVTGMEFIFVTGGSFMMGDAFEEGLADEIPLHHVQLDGFYMGRYPVTQGQWKNVMKHNPSFFDRGDAYPVEQVSLPEVNTFLDKLAELNHGRYPFSLPTEAQWEYAARSGGKKEKYAGGDNIDGLAWYTENSKGSTHPVGKKNPNGRGLYDMSGNVWEWCRDIFSNNAYTDHAPVNPVYTENGSDHLEHVIRGGSWNLDAWSCRCSRRFGYSPEFMGPGLGFRLVTR
ncbi:MAG: SUMF1/EgtB/PvdO family nonheme iron enzyme [Desulfobacterales bacterium]|nr:SUMF1/EgtB/PvdO family nonheme iron enzyme [Desulfobacterales bacterium]MDD4391943.1 SUMF1/EgtB/PvdO family nonheme iron enzyme [Desulfobacterales bacterium]